METGVNGEKPIAYCWHVVKIARVQTRFNAKKLNSILLHCTCFTGKYDARSDGREGTMHEVGSDTRITLEATYGEIIGS